MTNLVNVIGSEERESAIARGDSVRFNGFSGSEDFCFHIQYLDGFSYNIK